MQHRRPRPSKKRKTFLTSAVALAAAAASPSRRRARRTGRFTQALVRRKLLGNDKHVSGIASGTEVFKGTGRPVTRSNSVDIG
ncbi:hypothetical protein [Streptomyces guryensis]|uniref:Uncharacterized protein n=1 Tax=Streptomyces guryensis TaxID=2886947 RepID=A0A9Q3VQV9_9ACTN|nr:hypothetical protein [Streptomyces guryensis]MCD9876796.1 hypothetical protein [Streptomyces guryensis]